MTCRQTVHAGRCTPVENHSVGVSFKKEASAVGGVVLVGNQYFIVIIEESIKKREKIH